MVTISTTTEFIPVIGGLFSLATKFPVVTGYVWGAYYIEIVRSILGRFWVEDNGGYPNYRWVSVQSSSH